MAGTLCTYACIIANSPETLVFVLSLLLEVVYVEIRGKDIMRFMH